MKNPASTSSQIELKDENEKVPLENIHLFPSSSSSNTPPSPEKVKSRNVHDQ